LAENLAIDHSFSSKPASGVGYNNYHEKMTAYVAIFLSHAQSIDPNVTAIIEGTIMVIVVMLGGLLALRGRKT